MVLRRLRDMALRHACRRWARLRILERSHHAPGSVPPELQHLLPRMRSAKMKRISGHAYLLLCKCPRRLLRSTRRRTFTASRHQSSPVEIPQDPSVALCVAPLGRRQYPAMLLRGVSVQRVLLHSLRHRHSAFRDARSSLSPRSCALLSAACDK